MKKQHRHLLSVDLESWIFSERTNKMNLSIDSLKKLDNNYTIYALEYLLQSLKKNNQKITFFVVTKLEEIYPGLIAKILNEGHEVGWHTHTHPQSTDLRILNKELSVAIKIIRKYKMKGFQAPKIMFLKEGYRLLKKAGFEYSSSTYGNANTTHVFDGIVEVPVSTNKDDFDPKKDEIIFPSLMKISNIRKSGIPIGSSFFWSILGIGYYNKKITEASNKDRVINMFIHEWQIITPDSEKYRRDVRYINPMFLPYRKNVNKMFLDLIKNHRFMRFDDYVRKIKNND